MGKSIRGQFDYGGTFDRDTFQRGLSRHSEAVLSVAAAAGSFGTFGRGAGGRSGFADSGPPALLVRPSAAKELRIERAVLDSDLEESEIASNAYIRREGINIQKLSLDFTILNEYFTSVCPEDEFTHASLSVTRGSEQSRHSATAALNRRESRYSS